MTKNSIRVSPEFKRRAKQFLKKYHTLRESISDLTFQLLANPEMGVSYGNGIYKVRLGDESKGKGKSGGFRVLYYNVVIVDGGTVITLATIFDKSEDDTIKKHDAIKLINHIIKENEKP